MMVRCWMLGVVLLGGPAVAYAGTDALWRVVSGVTPTMVPPYAGEPSPFPQPIKVGRVGDISSSEDLDRFQRWETALHRAEMLLNSKAGFEPNVSGVEIGGKTDGPLGPRLMVSGEWVGANQTVYVRRKLSPAAESALADLETINPTEAGTVRQSFMARLDQEPYTPVKIMKIHEDSLEIEHEGIVRKIQITN